MNSYTSRRYAQHYEVVAEYPDGRKELVEYNGRTEWRSKPAAEKLARKTAILNMCKAKVVKKDLSIGR